MMNHLQSQILKYKSQNKIYPFTNRNQNHVIVKQEYKLIPTKNQSSYLTYCTRKTHKISLNLIGMRINRHFNSIRLQVQLDNRSGYIRSSPLNFNKAVP